MKQMVQNRRDFLKGAGAVAAGAALGLTGCSQPGSSTSNSVTTSEQNWDGEYDVIVVGAGIAGMTSAITVATEGEGASCLLLEKDVLPNGNSPFCMGGTDYTDHPEDVLVYFKALIGDSTPEDVIEAFVNGMTESLDWIKSLGANEGDMVLVPEEYKRDETSVGEYPELPNDDTITFFMFNGAAGGPSHIHEFLTDVVNQHSDAIDYQTSTPMESLVQDTDGTIIGVVANGKRLKANKGVIMCTGGYESDPTMLYNYTGVHGAKPIAGRSNTGDGHRACMKAGADMWHMHGGACYWMACRDLENTRHISSVWNYTNKRYGITVGMNGRRFYQDFDGCGIYGALAGIKEQLAAPDSNMACNVGYRHGITQFGGNWTHLPFPEKGWFIFDSAGLEAGAMDPEVSKDIVGDGWALTGNTIEELAEAIEVPADELTQTLELWNRYCDEGKDEAFFRPAETLIKITQPPYYAMLCAPAVLNTDGGPVRDAKARILDPFGNPIPHLYSAGEFGSVWGQWYTGGGNLAECSAFGRIAARSALAGE